MKTLPVPELAQTLPRWEQAVAAVADAETLARTQERLRDFADGVGPRVQAELESFAQAEDAAGRSWLAQDWLDGYLTVRTPLPLSTNVAFQIAGDFGAPGLERAAAFLARAVSVHLAEARGETAPEVDARENTMDPGQWACLNGGIRHPRPDRDEIRRSTLGAASREVGVFFRSRLFAVPVSDDAGRPLPVETLRAALEQVVASDAAPDAQNVAAPSHLGSAALSPLLEEMLQDAGNAVLYQRLTDFLLTVSLVPEAQDDAAHLRDLAFRPGHVWAHKPISYEVGLADEWVCLHAEHSTVDGATLLALVGRIQDAQEAGSGKEAGAAPAEQTAEGASASIAEPEELRWHIAPDQQERLDTELAEVGALADRQEVRIVLVPGLPEELPFKVSGDAAMQLVMTAAQVLAFGRARSTYEAVDMREYQAGRTECLRPVTPEAVDCARALAEGSADDVLRLLPAALDAHRGWVKACKAGQGPDRHLLGLARAAQRIGVEHPLFEDAGTEQAAANVLSTTSIGGADRIVSYAFVPARPEGFGISYTPRPDGFEYCVCWDRETAERPEGFLEALGTAGRRLRDALEQG